MENRDPFKKREQKSSDNFYVLLPKRIFFKILFVSWNWTKILWHSTDEARMFFEISRGRILRRNDFLEFFLTIKASNLTIGMQQLTKVSMHVGTIFYNH